MRQTLAAPLLLCLLLAGAHAAVAAEPAASAPVIRVGRFDAVLAALCARGLAVVEPRSSQTPEGATFREMACTDFDGNLVVLYQLDAQR